MLKSLLGRIFGKKSTEVQEILKKTHKEVINEDLTDLKTSTTRQFGDTNSRDLEFYRICASQVSYEKWSRGDLIGDTYQVEGTFYNDKGLKIVILAPLKAGDPPILCCKGTTSKQNIIDDLSLSGIGQYSFGPSKDEIKDMLKNLAIKYKSPVVVTGHSLGGAIAQVIAANFSADTVDGKNSLIKEVYYYNSPGVGNKVANLYTQTKAECESKGLTLPKIFGIRHSDDIVFLAGGKHIQTNQDFKFWHNKRIKTLKAHSIGRIFEKYNISESSGKRAMHKVLSVVIESVRTGILGKIVSVALQATTPSDNTLEKTKRIANTLIGVMH